MSAYKGYELYEKLRDYLGAEEVLNELAQYVSDDDLNDCCYNLAVNSDYYYLMEDED